MPNSKWTMRNPEQIKASHFVQILFACVLIFVVIVVVSIWLPFAYDWHHTYRPVALHLLQGGTPYDYEAYFNPPWALLPLVPIALLPENIGRAVMLVLTLLSFTFVALRLGTKPIALGFLLISPPAVHCFMSGNIEWLAVLGLVLPPQIGLFFLLIKPQLGGAVALYWLIESVRQGGILKVARLFAPVTVASLISLLLYGLWPMHMPALVERYWNASLWPISIPLGLGFLVSAIRQRQVGPAMAASPFLFPYVMLQSWIVALFAIVALPAEMVAVVIGLWILVAIRIWGG